MCNGCKFWIAHESAHIIYRDSPANHYEQEFLKTLLKIVVFVGLLKMSSMSYLLACLALKISSCALSVLESILNRRPKEYRADLFACKINKDVAIGGIFNFRIDGLRNKTSKFLGFRYDLYGNDRLDFGILPFLIGI